jgi:hypothetical protein
VTVRILSQDRGAWEVSGTETGLGLVSSAVLALPTAGNQYQLHESIRFPMLHHLQHSSENRK